MNFYEEVSRLICLHKTDHQYLSVLSDIAHLYQKEFIGLSEASYLISKDYNCDRLFLIKTVYILKELYFKHIVFDTSDTILKDIKEYIDEQIDAIYLVFKAVRIFELKEKYLSYILPRSIIYSSAKITALSLMYEYVTAGKIKEKDAKIMSDPDTNYSEQQIYAFCEIYHQLNSGKITLRQAETLLNYVRSKDGALMIEIINTVARLNNDLLDSPLLRDILSAPNDEYSTDMIKKVRLISRMED